MGTYSTPDVLNFSDGGWNGNGWGGIIPGFLGGIFGGALFGNGFGGWGNNGNASAALGAQATANNNTDLLMNAINNVGTTIGQDFNSLNTSLTGIGSTLNGMAVTQATTPLQIANAIQTGNMGLQQQLSQCCCENRLLTTEQGYQSQIRTLEQTNQLGAQADRNTNSIVAAINAQTVAMNDQFCQVKEREMQNKIDALEGVNAQLRDQAQTTTLQLSLAQIQAQIAALAARIPETTPATTSTTGAGA